ncbi:glutathione S-transferase C-terminal domain-containing protein isoform X2 [Eurytemora carolleeae]|uniref:glutathione S-transferase C-terminal domain-containing protein isoform X2 n=1 Tax=Eurytemora carolleeae TaxID=1294199 RepID=UPI000C75AD40|nr:glutathione S-transferase C-terminal domain-containing protein isoform X2 [Eurytemora carolleeae]|eukprot:XP_023330838.1 glutathione S-transferase C-terminal domain-containing protein-like isoform X2 [Eurytemora affinis]
MPHKRKIRKDNETKLLFEPDDSFLFLAYTGVSSDSLLVPLDTLVTLSILKYIGADLKVYLVCERKNEFSVNINKSGFRFELVDKLPDQASKCRLPVWYLPNQLTCLAGLCSVVRYAVKLVSFTNPLLSEHKQLLGHQMNCLSAPAEVSTWTKFCELEVPTSISHFMSSNDPHLPVELSRLEVHLKQPLRIHNIRKRMQDAQKKISANNEKASKNESSDLINNSMEENENCKVNSNMNGKKIENKNDKDKARKQAEDMLNIQSYSQDQHIYLEGPDLLISDLIVYSCLYLLFSNHSEIMKTSLPLLYSWMNKVGIERGAEGVLQEILHVQEQEPRSVYCVSPVHVPDESLYKCDPKRETCRTFTNQMDIDRNLDWWQDSGLVSLQSYLDPGSGFGEESEIDWSNLPLLVHPQAGELPADRLQRKCSQLQGLVLPLQKIAAKRCSSPHRFKISIEENKFSSEVGRRCIIVDFCSGGGHLGLLLAHLIPQAEVHMVENKEESLARARERGLALGLKNVWYYQANMEYYQGVFDIGCSLHACGVATDIVIAKCIVNRADFVCSPCCYGAVQPIENIKYPRSFFYFFKFEKLFVLQMKSIL